MFAKNNTNVASSSHSLITRCSRFWSPQIFWKHLFHNSSYTGPGIARTGKFFSDPNIYLWYWALGEWQLLADVIFAKVCCGWQRSLTVNLGRGEEILATNQVCISVLASTKGSGLVKCCFAECTTRSSWWRRDPSPHSYKHTLIPKEPTWRAPG